MSYKMENNYDKEQKVWSREKRREYYASGLSVGEIIFHELRRHPQLIAQISDSEGTVLTRQELFLNSIRVASYMRSLGLKQSDIVGVIARNTTHISAVVYGCFFNGIAFHSLNIDYEQSTIEKLFNLTKPRLIFCDGEDYEKVKSATESLNVKIITMRNHQSGSISIQEVLKTPVEAGFLPAVLEQGIDQTLAILCSSGTTGIPKAVTITNNQKLSNSLTPFTTNDVLYGHSTLDWLSGLWLTIASGAYSCLRVLNDRPFDPVNILRIIEQYKVSCLFQVPSHMAMMVNCLEFEKTKLDSIKAFFFAGSACSLEIQQSIRNRLQNDCLFNSYGLTELGLVCISRSFDNKPNSLGQLSDGFKAKILDENGENLGPNNVGEICIHSSKYWAGYYNNPEETLKMRDASNWFHTGDLGYMDDDGFLYVVDRKKDMLKYQNIMYYPHEIEEIISKMPGVAEVCVFGIGNELVGDEAAAAVVKKIGSDINAQDVINFVKQHSNAIYKQLHGGALIVDDIKRSPNTKTNRNATKAYFLELKGKEK